MKRFILPACTALLLTACASGADVAEESDASADSAVIEALEGAAPGPDAESSGSKQTP